MRARVARAAALACALTLTACAASPVQVESFEVGSRPPLERLALVPFSIRIPLEAGPGAESAAPVVTSRVLEALTRSGIEVVPPAEVAMAIANAGDPTESAEIGRAVREAFGADAMLMGRVYRFRAREGGAQGAARPASVWFDLELRGVDGVLLWRGTYDETQRSVSEDPGSFELARERGFRWVTAEELARYGAEELVRELAAEIARWR